jgi:hypothetical protein
VIDFCGWDRTLDDVARAVKRLIPDEALPTITISDCHSYQNVAGFLYHDVKTAILPFAAQSEMLEGMNRVAQEHKPYTSRARREENLPGVYERNVDQKIESGFTDVSFRGYAPLIHPEKLIFDQDVFTAPDRAPMPFSIADFIAVTAQ